MRQICWAHLKRDFQKCVDRGGPAVVIGQAGLQAVEDLFRHWWDFRQRKTDRAGLQRALRPIKQEQASLRPSEKVSAPPELQITSSDRLTRAISNFPCEIKQ